MAAWTELEQRACVQAYQELLMAERAGEPMSKAAVNRWLRGDASKAPADAKVCGLQSDRPLPFGALSARSRGSVEMKMMNISAARIALGLDVIAGYKPFGNAQKSLTQFIQENES